MAPRFQRGKPSRLDKPKKVKGPAASLPINICCDYNSCGPSAAGFLPSSRLCSRQSRLPFLANQVPAEPDWLRANRPTQPIAGQQQREWP